MTAEVRGARRPAGAGRLLGPALVAWAGAAWAVARPGTGAIVAIVALACGAVLLAWAAWPALSRSRLQRPSRPRPAGRERRPSSLARAGPVALRVLALSCAALLVIGARIASEEGLRAAPDLADDARAGRRVELLVELRGFPRLGRSPDGPRAWVRAQTRAPEPGVPVLLWLEGDAPAGWAVGTRLRVAGRAQELGPGSWAAFGLGVRQLSEATEDGAAWPAIVLGDGAASLRAGLTAAAASVPGAELVPGFAVGDTSLVPEELDRRMRESSLAHLTAVSGANCALVIGAAIALSARLGAGRRVRLLVAALALAAFAGIVGPDASLQRAAIMAAVLLASGFGGRPASAFPALGMAILVLLIHDPWQALDPGFSRSVAATGGILIGAAPLAAGLRRHVRVPRALALPIAVALAAQLSCGPLLLLLQPGIPAVGVLANVLAAPAAPVGTGLGLLAAALLPLAPPLAHVALLGATAAARWVSATAEVTLALPLARWHWPEGWPGALLLGGCELALLLAWALRGGHVGLPVVGRRPRRTPWRAAPATPPAIRITAAALVSGAFGTAVAVTLVTPAAEGLGVPRDWAVVACDVGQGDAVLLRDPARPGEVMLVDTGDEPDLLLACLSRFGVDRISLLVLSHDDRDHVGALPAIEARVDSALIAPPHAPGKRPVAERLRRAGIPVTIGAEGVRSARGAPGASAAPGAPGASAVSSAPDVGPLRGEPRTQEKSGSEPGSDLRWEVLAPAATVTPSDANAASLVMVASAGGFRVLLLGDTGADEQRGVLRHGDRLRADVVKVAHHGSRDQDPSLPARVGARIALVSVGARNRYGHPNEEFLAALSRAGSRSLRTDEHGSLALAAGTDGPAALRVWVERGGQRRARPRGGGSREEAGCGQ